MRPDLQFTFATEMPFMGLERGSATKVDTFPFHLPRQPASCTVLWHIGREGELQIAVAVLE